MVIYFNLVSDMGLKKPEPKLWTLTVCNKMPAEIQVQTKYAINTQHLNVFTSVLHAAHSNRHQVDCVWNAMAHAQKPYFVFRRNGWVHLNRRGRQFSRLLAVEVCASVVVMLDTPCSEVVWRVLATHSIRQFPLHFPSRASQCAVTFHLDSTFVMKP